jgi:diguanylate cyclase (GGDEF)-like protein
MTDIANTETNHYRDALNIRQSDIFKKYENLYYDVQLPKNIKFVEEVLENNRINSPQATLEIAKELTEKDFRLSHDPLTKFLNRGSFFRTMESLEKSEKDVYVAYIDMDNFKKINDVFSHTYGDEVLAHTAKKVLENIDFENDYPSRVGGDELALIFTDKTKDQVQECLAKIRYDLNKFIDLNISIGIEKWDKNELVEAVLHKAELKMYEEKNRKKFLGVSDLKFNEQK